MNKHKVLIVDDNRKTVAMIRLYLEHDGYDVLTAYDGQQALAITQTQQPDLIVLDLMLPQVGGLDVCRRLRMQSRVPIVMLTARATEEDKLRGLDLGADDYVTKPFSPRELMARVRAVLRRVAPATFTSGTVVHRQNIEIDVDRREVRVSGKRVSLTPTEFKLLEVLGRSPGQVFTRQELVEKALGWDYDGLDRTVDAHVMNLRRKIKQECDQPSPIVTVFGVGYKFAEADRDE